MANNLHAIVCQRLMPRALGRGVVPGLEVMINTPVVRKLIMEDRMDRLPNAIEAGAEEGMMSFNQCLLRLVNDGLITEEMALERASSREALKMNLQGIFLTSDRSIIGE